MGEDKNDRDGNADSVIEDEDVGEGVDVIIEVRELDARAERDAKDSLLVAVPDAEKLATPLIVIL